MESPVFRSLYEVRHLHFLLLRDFGSIMLKREASYVDLGFVDASLLPGSRLPNIGMGVSGSFTQPFSGETLGKI
jgi:hypothetical protein